MFCASSNARSAGFKPAIDHFQVSDCGSQRVVLLSYDAATKRVSLRHYSIHSAPSGVTKGVKSVVAGSALPDLAKLEDVSELLLRSGYGSVRTANCLLTAVQSIEAMQLLLLNTLHRCCRTASELSLHLSGAVPGFGVHVTKANST